MSMLDNLLGQSGVDLGALGARVGLTPDQVSQGAEAILARLGGGGMSPNEAAAGAAAETGLSLASLQALLPALQAQLGEGGLQGLAAQLGGEGGLLAGLDRDGDGNPINDLTGMARGLFS